MLWRIHENRKKQGLGGTKVAQNVYDEDEHVQDRGFRINNGLHLSFQSIVDGTLMRPMIDNAFVRFHKSIEQYPQEHENMDDVSLYQIDNLERMKPLMPKKGTVVGTTSLIPTPDTDEKLIFHDTQGESLYTNPPDPNVPVIDYGMDELSPWSFRRSNYNQMVIVNDYTNDMIGQIKEMQKAPWWGLKLSTPAFYKQEKYVKFLQQFAMRMDFEALKIRQAAELRPGDLAQRDAMKAEVLDFLASKKLEMLQTDLKDVYVTDHVAKARKFSTLSAQEDAEFYSYLRSLEEYNQQPAGPQRVSRFESGRYERGSLH